MQRRTALAVGGLILVLFSFNTSFLAPWRGSPRVIAHRGVHQTFSPVGVQNDTCTASRADPIEHSWTAAPTDTARPRITRSPR